MDFSGAAVFLWAFMAFMNFNEIWKKVVDIPQKYAYTKYWSEQ